MAFKDKLLEVIGTTDLDDLSETRLLDIIKDKLAAQKEQIERLKIANNGERIMLHRERERLNEEHRELRNNPNIFMASQHYFIDVKERFVLRIIRGKPELARKAKNGTLWIVREVTPAEFDE